MLTYYPENVSLSVDGQQINLLADPFLKEVEEGFYLHLQACSPSREMLNTMSVLGKIIDVDIQVDIRGEDNVRITDFDIKGRYVVDRIGCTLGIQFPTETFLFTNVGEIG